ncbi:1-phosphatidylinositol 4,5-bisphosphate phosphodiesterase delta-4-like isoform X2 [Lineus longissimus]|uniref:1-phosphatidylinositol 4,5-bisphosphate phosphodiesterase delta-4-like isoform X2 n=1 Tax=Lineus longissimus TaxID=88925 RepID=UPI002B4E200F
MATGGNGPHDYRKILKQPVNKCIEQVSSGSSLTKVRRSRSFDRGFKVKDGLTMEQTNSKKIFPWHRNSYSVDEIVEVRTDMNTEVFNKNKSRLSNVPENRCFSLVIGSKRKTLDLVADNTEERDTWVRGIQALVSKRNNSNIRDYQDSWVKEFFIKADKDKDGSLTFKEIEKVLPEMGIDIKKSHIELLFEAANTDKAANKKGQQSLDKDEFVAFCRSLQARPEVDQIFEVHTQDGEYMKKQEFKKFLAQEQKMTVSDQYVLDMFKAYEPSEKARLSERMSIEGFRLYLLDGAQHLMKPEHKKIFQDMTRPLTDYFINSSHNTYLMGDQLKGTSSTEAYINVLEKGCRCVELDCWDGPDNEPIVYHGHTLTSKILFKDCIKAINDYAFKASKYPVLLSFENHCSVEQQKVLAKYTREIMGDNLLTNLFDACPDAMCSAELAKGKILVKGKRGKKIPKPIKPEGEENEEQDEDEDWDEADYASEDDEAADIEHEMIGELKRKEEEEEEEKKKKKKKKGLAIAKEFSELCVYMSGVKFTGFQDAFEKNEFYNMSSLKEKKFKKILETEADIFVENNKRFLVRLYPDGSRTDSSNYDPCDGWICGAQIVALNYQTPSKGVQLIQGLFSINGETGYVLKPAFLRDRNINFDPRGPFPIEWEKKLTITVISGYQLPKNPKSSGVLDPYVKVKIYGVKADRQKQATDVVKNNGFNPVWNDRFTFTVKVPELAFLRLAVKDSNTAMADTGLAYYCIPFESMQQGYRHVKLRKPDGRLTKRSFLLLHVKIESEI